MSRTQQGRSNDLQRYEAALVAAVEKRIQYHNDAYRFFDPGISLIALRELLTVQENRLVRVQCWYDQCLWANREDIPRQRTLVIPVEGSFSKTFADQVRLLSGDEEVASVRSVAMFLVINALATGERLLSNRYVRCIDKDLGGGRARVGYFGRDGLVVDSSSDDTHHSGLGIASSRKS